VRCTEVQKIQNDAPRDREGPRGRESERNTINARRREPLTVNRQIQDNVVRGTLCVVRIFKNFRFYCPLERASRRRVCEFYSRNVVRCWLFVVRKFKTRDSENPREIP
jgi:hypothetical protein